jgi:excisionase family DNA binding protein
MASEGQGRGATGRHPRTPLTLHEAAERLGVQYATAERYIRSGRLPAVKSGSVWLVDPRALSRLNDEPTAPRRRTSGAGALADRMVAGDERGAWSLLESALAHGTTRESIVLELLTSAMQSIGDGWASGHLTVADEHQGSAVAARLNARLGARWSGPRRAARLVVLAAPSGEQHALPVAMAANVLRWRGYRVRELGADTPPFAAADAARAPDVLALGLVCSGARGMGALAKTMRAVRAAAPQVPIVLGGREIADARHARDLGADAYSGRSADALAAALEDRRAF